jgi:hypothetical protein
MQLVWVQTDVGSDKYQFCSKWQTGKKGMLTIPVRTVCTDDDVADRMDDVAECTLTWQKFIGQMVYDVFWQRMGMQHVDQSKAATYHLFIC